MYTTIMISMSQVPLYLQKGAFFPSLDADDEEMFEVPSHCLKPDKSIRSADDLTHLLHSVRFCGVFDLSADSVGVIRMNMKKQHLYALLEEFPEHKTFLGTMFVLVTSQPHKVIFYAIQRGAEKGEVAYLHEKMGFELHPECWSAAFLNDDVESVAYLLKKKVPYQDPWTFAAAAAGSIKCLKFARSQRLQFEKNSLLVAAQNGHREVVRFLHEIVDMPLTELTMEFAALSGNLVLMRYLHSNGCLWNASVCFAAAKSGNLDCLRFAHENGCPWDKGTTMSARVMGYHSCLRYAVENGCDDLPGTFCVVM